MSPVNGYYSLVQFCPDRARLETVNLGLLLFCPELQFLDVRMSRGNQRARRLFGRDYAQIPLKFAKEAFRDRIHRERETIKNLGALEEFIDRRANHFLLTSPRTVSIEDPVKTLESMFEELVGEEEYTERKPSLKKALRKRIEQSQLLDRVSFEIEPVVLPELDKEIKPDLGFQNGRFNIVRTAHFNDARRVFPEVCQNAIAGREIYRLADHPLGALQLFVLADFPSSTDSHIPKARSILKEHDVQLIPNSEVDSFIRLIEETARPLPDSLRTSS